MRRVDVAFTGGWIPAWRVELAGFRRGDPVSVVATADLEKLLAVVEAARARTDCVRQAPPGCGLCPGCRSAVALAALDAADKAGGGK